MGNSLQQAVPVRCSCGAEYSADIFLIVDPSEDPRLAQAVQGGTLNLAVCPRCKQSTRPSYPVLLLQEDEIPPMVMAFPLQVSQGEATPLFESLLGLWVSRIGPDAPMKLSSAAFQLHPLIVPFEHLLRFTDGVGKRPRGVAWKAAFGSLTRAPNLAKDAFAELAAKSLTLWTPDDPPVELAFLKGRLGTAVDDPEKAIIYLTEALEVLKPNEFPHWGTWKYDLGCHYAEQATGERGRNVELAVACFEEALGHLSPNEDPLTWAMCSSNLSALYGERLLGGRTENCERALHHVQNTFSVFTPQSYPENCARSHIIAGQSFRDRLLGDKNENIEKAIEHYGRALDHFRSTGAQDESATIHALLGQAYLIRTAAIHFPFAADAIRHIEIALHTITKERDPFRWAGNILNLALAHEFLPGDVSMNVGRAIYYYKEAMSILTQDRFPIVWADCQANLGRLVPIHYRDSGGDWRTKAIEHLRAALTAYSEEEEPIKYMQTQETLAEICFDSHQHQEALESYLAVLRVKEKLFDQAFTEASRYLELKSVAKVSSRAVVLLILLGRAQEALEEHERWRAKLVKEAVAWERLANARMEDVERSRLRNTAREVERIQAQLRAPWDPTISPLRLTDQLQRTHESYKRLLKEFHGSSNRELSPMQIFSHIPVGGALIIPVRSKELFLFFFVIQHGRTAVLDEDVVTTPQPFFSESGDPLYKVDQAVQMEPEKFAQYLCYIASHHIDYLIAKVAECELVAGSTILVLGTPLEVLGLHTATVWTKRGRAEFLDQYSIRYAPGCELLHLCEERLIRRGLPRSSLVAVLDPSKDLPFAGLEIEMAKGAFEISECLLGDAATSEAVVDAVSEHSYLHFACHGFSSLEDPLNSALTLAQGAQFTAEQVIKDLDLSKCHLVVLSACQTGLVNSTTLETEYLGLPIAFLQAGAPAVISTLWSVEDESTMLLMHQFYKLHRRSGVPASVALGKAQRWLRSARNADIAGVFEELSMAVIDSEDEGSLLAYEAFKRYAASDQNGRPFEEPHYWAPFIYMGAEILPR